MEEDALSDGGAELGHAVGEPGRHTSAVQRQVGDAGTLHDPIVAAGVLPGGAARLRIRGMVRLLRGAALLLLSAPLYAQLPFNQIAVFGDSLSDNGNLYYGTSLLGLPTPGPPQYATGEYTDGANSVPSTKAPLGLWIEQLAASLSLPVPQPFSKGGLNYAVASAQTGSNPAYSPSLLSIPWSTDQVGIFLKSTPAAPANYLYAFWCGANDVLNGASATAAAANVQANINSLANAGARYFLWVNLPPLGEVPESIGTSQRAALDAASVTYNNAMTAAIA